MSVHSQSQKDFNKVDYVNQSNHKDLVRNLNRTDQNLTIDRNTNNAQHKSYTEYNFKRPSSIQSQESKTNTHANDQHRTNHDQVIRNRTFQDQERLAYSINNSQVDQLEDMEDMEVQYYQQFQDGQVDEDKVVAPYFRKLMKENDIKYKENKSKEKFKRLKEEVQQKFALEHPFKPRINYDFSKANLTRNQGSKDDIYKRLSTPKLIQQNTRLKEREELEQKRLKEECPFQPNAHKQGKTDIKSNVNDRLYRLSEQLREKREKLRREFQENENREFTFTPNIDEKSKNLMLKYSNKIPIYERSDEILQEKKEALHQMRIDKENQDRSKYNNFKPKINHKSKELAERKMHDRSFDNAHKADFLNISNNRLDAEDVAERLYKNTGKRNRDLPSDSDLKNCTFVPNAYSINLNDRGNVDDFINRQIIYEEMKKERLERKLSKSIQPGGKPFTPQINTTSDILMRADHTRAIENTEDKVDRLYRKNYEKIKSRKENLAEFYNSQYDFKPKINEISRYVGRNTNIGDISYKSESTKARKWKEHDYNSQLTECTFKPRTNEKAYENVHSNYKLDEHTSKRIQEEMIRKKEHIEEIKKMVDLKEADGLKFHPETNKNKPNFELNEPIVMKGFAKHIEKMEKARKARLEKEQREKEVFITGENWSKDNLVTIPKPFRLSYVNFLI